MNKPPVPADADLQDFPYMPLHVARLRDSDLAAEAHPEACWYAVLLWAASWHQLPAGSIPDNDNVLARLCGLGRDLRTFRRHRADALRGFELCDDGRMYHPVVAEQVLSAWRGKVEQRHRTECARIRKANQRAGTETPYPTLPQFVSEHYPATVPYMSHGTEPDVPRETPSKRKRKGEGDSIVDEDAGDARGGEVAKAEPVDPFGSIGQLTARFGKAAGVSVNPARVGFADQLDIVRGWIALGLDPDTEIVPILERDAAGDGPARHSLKYFTPAMSKLAAQKEARANGTPGSHGPTVDAALDFIHGR